MSKTPPAFSATLAFSFTRDLERAKHFYGDVLNLQLVMELDSAVLFHVTGASYVGLSLKSPAPGGSIQEFVAADRVAVGAWHARLIEAGTTVDGPPRAFEAADAYGFFAEDPDGNRLEFLSFDNNDALEPSR